MPLTQRFGSALTSRQAILLCFVACLLLALGTIGIGIIRYDRLAEAARRDTAQDMLTTVLGRAEILQAEVQERIGDTVVLASLPSIHNGLNPALPPEQRGMQLGHALTVMNQVQLSYGYRSVVVANTRLEPVLRTQGPLDLTVMDEIGRRALIQREAVVSDLRRGPNNRVYFGVAAPILTGRDASADALGVAYVERDATALVRRLLEPWPSPYASPEVSLLRSARGEIHYVHLERPAEGGPAQPRFTSRPASNDPMGRRALSARQAEVLGPLPDHDEVEVIAAVAAVEGLPWRVVGQISRAEIDTPVRNIASLFTAVVVTLTLVTALVGLVLFYHGRQRRLLRETELSRQLASSLRTMMDGFIRLGADGLVESANQAALDILGLDAAGARGLRLATLEANGQEPAWRVALTRREPQRFRARWRLTQGRVVEIDGSANYVPDQHGGHLFLVVRDITEDLRTHRQTMRLNALQRVLNHAHEAIQRTDDPRQIVAEIGRVEVADPQIILVMTAWVDRAAARLSNLAASGPAREYADGLEVSLDPRQASSTCPSGRAVLDNRLVVSNDLLADSRGLPWHDRTRDFGVASAIALPLTVEGEVVAIFTLCTDEIGYFDADAMALMREFGESLSVALEAARARQLAGRVQRMLAASEQRLRNIIDASPVAITVVSAEDGSISATNAAFDRLLGYPRGTFFHMSSLMDAICVKPDQLEMLKSRHQHHLQEVRRQGTSTVVLPEIDVRRADGTLRQVQGSMALVGEELVLAWLDLTELRERESALRWREETYAAVLRQSGDGIILVDAETTGFIEFNDAAARLLGYTRDEFAGLTLGDIRGDSDKSTIQRLAEAPELSPLTLRRRARRKDGSLIDVRVSVAAVTVNGRNCFATFISDLTDELRSAERLAAEAEKQRVLFHQASHGMAVVRPDGGVAEANASLLAMLGLDAEAARTARVTDWGIALPNDLAATSGVPLEAVLRRADGSQLDAEVVWSLAALPGGELLYCSVLDITARKRSERELERIRDNLERLVADRTTDLADTALQLAQEREALAASNDELKTIFDSAPVGIVLLRDQEVLRCNPAMEAMFGAAPGAMAGMQASEWYFSRTAQAAVESEIRELTAGRRRELRHEVELRRADGTAFWARMTGLPFNSRLMQGHLLKIVEDISLERAAAATMREAKEQAEAANRAKSTFLAVMSHEIRTPLNGIIGMSELLTHEALPPQSSEAVRIVNSSAINLMSLIDDILDFSKIEADRLELEQQPVPLARLVEGVCDSLIPALRSRGVDLSASIHPDTPPVLLADPTRLRQVLFNVIGNAVKFSGGRAEKRGLVTVRVEPEGESRLRVAVADNGIGMAPEVMARLFTPFTQAERETTRRFGGTGLGLAITRRLLDRMQGSVTVTSTPGEGSCFAISLPVELPADVPAPPALPRLDGVTCALLCEDPVLDQSALAEILGAAGARLQRVAGLGAALALAAEAGPGLLLRVVDPEEPDPAPLPASVPWASVLLRRREHWSGRLERGDGAGESHDLGWLRRDLLLPLLGVAAGRLGLTALAEDRPVAGPLLAATAPSTEQARAAGQLILLAEDDEVNRKVIIRQLNRIGLAAEAATNGREALEMWRRGGYALVITDIAMPGMDGYQLARAIRAEEAGGPPIPVVALSANALRGEAELALEQGITLYLTKPILLPDLQAALARLLPADAGPAPAAPSAPASPAPAGGPPAVFDRAALPGLVGDDPATVAGFLQEFRDHLPELVTGMHEALEAGDLTRLAGLAHRLKSSSRSIGAMELGEACAALEIATQENAGIGVTSAMLVFEAAHTNLCRTLDAAPATVPAPGE